MPKRATINTRIRLTEDQKELLVVAGKALLAAIAVGGMLAIAITAPNLLKLIEPLAKKDKKYNNDDVRKVTRKIIKDHYADIFSKDGKKYLRLTGSGRRRLVEYSIDTVTIKKQRWDGKWRLVMFDIPEKYKAARDVLRRKLREIGFVKVQKSAWISPYECHEEIDFICLTYEVLPYVNYFIVSAADNEQSLKEIFSLS